MKHKTNLIDSKQVLILLVCGAILLSGHVLFAQHLACHVSGYVRTPYGTPISDVEIRVGGWTDTITDADGYYELSRDCTFSMAVAPYKDGCTFDPEVRLYGGGGTYTDQDYVGTCSGGPQSTVITFDEQRYRSVAGQRLYRGGPNTLIDNEAGLDYYVAYGEMYINPFNNDYMMYFTPFIGGVQDPRGRIVITFNQLQRYVRVEVSTDFTPIQTPAYLRVAFYKNTTPTDALYFQDGGGNVSCTNEIDGIKMVIVSTHFAENNIEELEFLGLGASTRPAPGSIFALTSYDGIVPLAWQEPAGTAAAASSTFGMETLNENLVIGETNNENEIAATLLGYNIYRSTSETGSYSKIKSNETRQYYLDTSVTNGQTYYYKITANYDTGESAFTRIVSAQPQENGNHITCSWASTPPTLNGVINAGEWSAATATSVTFPGKTGTVTLLLMNNATTLYAAVDNHLDTAGDDYDGIGIFFDENNDKAWPASGPSGEGLIQMYQEGGAPVYRYQGFHGTWPDQYGGDAWTTPAGVGQMISFNSGHMQIEASFNLTSSPLNASPGDVIGFLLYVLDATAGEFDGAWPAETFQLEPIAGGNSWAHAPFGFGKVTLASAATAPDISVTPPSWDFGSAQVGSVLEKKIVIHNDGTATLTISSIGKTGDISDFGGEGANYPIQIAPGATWQYLLYFFPKEVGARSASILIYSNDPDESPFTVELTGQGTSGSVLPSEWDYTENTGNSATIVLPTTANPNIDGTPLANGDYIGAFTPAGLCCGWSQWQGANLSITAWGDNDQTAGVIDGFTPGQDILYRVYRSSESKEWSIVAVGYSQGTGKYAVNGFMVLNKFDATEQLCMTLNLDQGWNMFSLNVSPDNPDISVVFNAIAGKIIIAKSGDGKSYIPGYGINDIGPLQLTRGYQIYLNAPATLEVCGMPMDVSTAVALPAGWSIISYLPRSPMDAAAALASIRNQLVLAKNNAGQTYIPAYGINDIGQMQPGQGYQIYLSSAATLVYPSGSAQQKGAAAIEAKAQPRHFGFTSRTGQNAVLILPAEVVRRDIQIQPGDEIGAFTPSGLCCGSGVWQGENLAITIWGDDDQSETIDGFRTGESISFRLRRHDGDEAIPLWIEFEQPGNECYRTNGFAVAAKIRSDSENTALAMEPPDAFQLLQNYPNPFNAETTIEYYLSQPANVELVIHDLQGNLVSRLQSGAKAAGYFEVKWDGRDQSGLPAATGVYFYRLSVRAEETGGASFVDVKKMVLMR
ncbi:choice-of-anchor D domain-containing protein [candidate division KSB1 bacterium]|nr:choice-of-anchor D domain-containing protein [candidate division KSB1 bacterium]